MHACVHIQSRTATTSRLISATSFDKKDIVGFKYKNGHVRLNCYRSIDQYTEYIISTLQTFMQIYGVRGLTFVNETSRSIIDPSWPEIIR